LWWYGRIGIFDTDLAQVVKKEMEVEIPNEWVRDCVYEYGVIIFPALLVF